MTDCFIPNLLQEMRPGPSNQSGLQYISGIICKSKILRFERMLFRATRGNMLFNQAPADENIVDPVSDEKVLFFLVSCSFARIMVYFFCSKLQLGSVKKSRGR